ncbi:hypothetical protein BDV19DRAFT_385334 [Aspergillus venezuelensis]
MGLLSRIGLRKVRSASKSTKKSSSPSETPPPTTGTLVTTSVAPKSPIAPAGPPINEAERTPVSTTIQHSSPATHVVSLAVGNSTCYSRESKDFWSDAFRRLQDSDDDKDCLATLKELLAEEVAMISGSTKQTNELSSERLLQIFQDGKDTLDDGQLKLRLGNLNIDVQAALNRVARLMTHAQQFVGALGSLEPHAAIAYAASNMFFPLLLNAVNQPKALVQGIDHVADIHYRFSVIESQYNQQLLIDITR